MDMEPTFMGYNKLEWSPLRIQAFVFKWTMLCTVCWLGSSGVHLSLFCNYRVIMCSGSKSGMLMEKSFGELFDFVCSGARKERSHRTFWIRSWAHTNLKTLFSKLFSNGPSLFLSCHWLSLRILLSFSPQEFSATRPCGIPVYSLLPSLFFKYLPYKK